MIDISKQILDGYGTNKTIWCIQYRKHKGLLPLYAFLCDLTGSYPALYSKP